MVEVIKPQVPLCHAVWWFKCYSQPQIWSEEVKQLVCMQRLKPDWSTHFQQRMKWKSCIIFIYVLADVLNSTRCKTKATQELLVMAFGNVLFLLRKNLLEKLRTGYIHPKQFRYIGIYWAYPQDGVLAWVLRQTYDRKAESQSKEVMFKRLQQWPGRESCVSCTLQGCLCSSFQVSDLF